MNNTIFIKVIFCVGSLLVFLLIPTGAQAAESCSVSVPNVSFGNVDVLPGAASDITGTVNLNCSSLDTSKTYRFCINIGSGTYFTGTQREIQESGSTRMDYQLYQDAARTIVWGSWQSGFSPPGLQIDVMPPASTHSFSVPLYARLFANQETAVTGSYTSSFPSSQSGVYVRFRNKNDKPCNDGNRNAQTGFTVSANVISSCYMSATNLNFGSVGVLDSNTDVTSVITAQCSNAMPYTVSLDDGSTTGGTTSIRLMTDGSDEVQYQMFSDASRLPANNWGDSVAESVSGSGNGNNQSLTVYGRVPVQTTPVPSIYADTVTVTVTY